MAIAQISTKSISTVYQIFNFFYSWIEHFEFLLFQGQKGETGPAGKSPQGAIKFGDTAKKCTLRTAGTVRYNASQNALQLCDGSAWLPLVTGKKGHVASRPGRHCMDILKSGQIIILSKLIELWTILGDDFKWS